MPAALDVLNDLWEVDPSLNDGITELGGGPVRDLPAGKRTGRGGLCLRLRPRADGYGGTYQDFVDSGYIDGEALFWKDGCLFSVKETQDETR